MQDAPDWCKGETMFPASFPCPELFGRTRPKKLIPASRNMLKESQGVKPGLNFSFIQSNYKYLS